MEETDDNPFRPRSPIDRAADANRTLPSATLVVGGFLLEITSSLSSWWLAISSALILVVVTTVEVTLEATAVVSSTALLANSLKSDLIAAHIVLLL